MVIVALDQQSTCLNTETQLLLTVTFSMMYVWNASVCENTVEMPYSWLTVPHSSGYEDQGSSWLWAVTGQQRGLQVPQHKDAVNNTVDAPFSFISVDSDIMLWVSGSSAQFLLIIVKVIII